MPIHSKTKFLFVQIMHGKLSRVLSFYLIDPSLEQLCENKLKLYRHKSLRLKIGEVSLSALGL